MTPKISVVFTSFNHKEFLAQALDSLLGQTFSDFELIVVDDCSTDGSQDVLKEYAAKDARIRLFLNEKNSGSYVYSTNQGATHATAPYVIFAQCDDYAEPTQFEKLYRAITENTGVGVAFSSSNMVDKNGNSMGDDFQYREKRFKAQCTDDTRIASEQIERYFLYSCVIPNLSAAIVRRELFDGLDKGYFVLADWDFWLKTSRKCDFYYIRESLNNFRQHDTTIRASVKLKRQVKEVFKMYYDHFERSGKSAFRWKLNICNIWISYVKQGPKAWLNSFFPILGYSCKYDFYFPLIMLLDMILFPVRFLGRKVIRWTTKDAA